MAADGREVLRQLWANLQYTPTPLRRAHLQRLERLIPELVSDRLYTYDYIFHRITLFDPSSDGATVVSGRILVSRLGLILRKMSLTAPLDAAEAGETVLPLASVAANCRVSLNTVKRWSGQGLPVACYLLPDGRREVGVRSSALDAFLSRHRTQPVGARRRITDEERQAILAQARELSVKGHKRAAVIARLVERTGFSSASIRRLLHKLDEPRAEKEAGHRWGLSPGEREQLVQLYRGGTSVRELARRFGRSNSTIYRVLHQALMKKVLEAKINYVPNPIFASPDAEAICLGEEGLFTYPPEPTSDMMKAPAGLPPYLAELYNIPLLSRERERELFRKYNYLKYRAAMLQEQIRRSGYRIGMLERFEELRQAAEQVKRILVRCNLRLVVSIAKRHVGPLAGLQELVSEGNMCLIRAVECYDFDREARFATYATWAISKHFARIVPEENYRAATFVTGQQEMLESVGDVSENTLERTEVIEHLRAVLAQATGRLTEREQAIIKSHYGTDGQPAKTLEEIGKIFGLTRERIRQIEARALAKLRDLISPETIEGVT